MVAGGALGVALRELLLLPFAEGATPGGGLALTAATLGVNVLGSFALGIVAGRLGDRRPHLRAFAGTGLIGGFTTYSAFAVQSAALLGAAPVTGIAFSAVSAVLGVAAALLGVRLTPSPPITGGPDPEAGR